MTYTKGRTGGPQYTTSFVAVAKPVVNPGGVEVWGPEEHPRQVHQGRIQPGIPFERAPEQGLRPLVVPGDPRAQVEGPGMVGVGPVGEDAVRHLLVAA